LQAELASTRQIYTKEAPKKKPSDCRMHNGLFKKKDASVSENSKGVSIPFLCFIGFARCSDFWKRMHAKMFDFSPVDEAIASQVFSRNYILMCS